LKKEIRYSPKESIFDYWRSFNTEPAFEEYADLINNHPLINSLSHLSNSCIFIFDHANIRYAYVQNELEKLTGYKPSQFLNGHWEFGKTLIPPPYHDFAIHFSHRLSFENVYNAKIADRKKYFFTKDYQYITKDRGIRHFLQKGMVLQMDAKGNIQLTLQIATDVTHLKKENSANLVITGPEGYSNIYSFETNSQILTDHGSLTKREKELLQLLEIRKDSKEIASQLGISSHTVDTHRRNLLAKLNCVDTTALITYCKMCELLE
jgi:DNA-binding CsgD family transcriptional regulator